MSGFVAPPGHSGASTSTASASQELPPPVQDQENNNRKRPREEDNPGLWDLDSHSEDALQGMADLQHLPQPLQQACKRRRLVLELKSFERFIHNFINWRRSRTSRDNTNTPAEGSAAEFPLLPGALSLQELESLPLVEDLESSSPHRDSQDHQEAAAAEGEVIQDSAAPDQVLHGHQTFPSPGQVQEENQPCPPTQGHVLHRHHVSPAQRGGIQRLQASPAYEHVIQGQQTSLAEVIQGRQVFPAEVIQGQQVFSAEVIQGQQIPPVEVIQGQQISHAEVIHGQRIPPAELIQRQRISPAEAIQGQRMSPAEVIQGQQGSPANTEMIQGQQRSPAEVIQGQQISPAEVQLVIQELQMSPSEGHMIYNHNQQVSQPSGDQVFMDSSVGGHVRHSHPMPPAPSHAFPGQQVSPASDQVVPGHQGPRLAGRGIQNVRYLGHQMLHSQRPMATADPALMNYPAGPIHQEQAFFNQNQFGPANIFHREHQAPHMPQAAATPTTQQQQQQQQQQDTSLLLSRDHFPRPIRSETKARARTLGCLRHSRLRMGLKRTSMMCQVCRVPLCVDCFYPFHVEMMQQK